MLVADYEEAVSLAVETLSRIPGISAVYRFGTLWQPGVSDIDLLVVCDEGAEPAIPGPWRLSPKAAYLFTHRYLTMGVDSAQELFALFPEETLRCQFLWGTEVDFRKPKDELSPAEYSWMIAGVFFDMLVTKLLPLAGVIPLMKDVDVRQRIGQLHSLKYSEILLHVLQEDFTCDTAFTEQVDLLYEHWFAAPKQEQLDLLEDVSLQAVSVIMGMVECFKHYTDTYVSDCVPLCFRSGRYTIRFTDVWSPKEFAHIYRRGFVRLGKFHHDTLLTPQTFGVFLTWYAAHGGAFGMRVRESIRSVSCVSPAPAGFLRHADALNAAFADYEYSHGTHKIPYTFGFSPGGGWPERVKKWVTYPFMVV
ncbi:hypothetical protein COU76_01970 [Candidatus Peregrinibacteria bacterium CG10_big_fil_rev_8_21_14_0_10_49_10]|nr:MAG: hypothetical protein COU76_01970 [Candidatus Peregrinibacteria bacterium CG10_big_fil_rev_8_21_14_0_10_49_10]